MTRRNNLDRCTECRMHATLCICALVPRIETRTRLALLIHERETHRPTNTGLLAARCLPGSTVEVIGAPDRRAVMPAIGEHEQPLLLYPADDAVPIADYAGSERPVVLLVPDGTWRQAHKMRKRLPGLAAVPCVVLPEAGPTEYHLRTQNEEGALCTFEAIARALRILEGDAAIEAQMMALFHVMVSRTRWLRGQLADHEVVDGLPEAAREQNPRSTPATRGER